ncbi:MAG: hypothetical protein J7639_24495 [Paenibacillaceae bacterium]|nr:hypothetical protein [Paenibacillaceae bacterium]
MRYRQLISGLERLGLPCRVMTHGKGKLVVLQRGARMLGVYPDADDDNVLWTSPALLASAAQTAPFAAASVWNTGGDRTWLSPEFEYNIADVSDMWNTYAVQMTVDPGDYRFTRSDADATSLTQVAVPQAYYTGTPHSLEIAKSFRPIPDPLLPLKDKAGSVIDPATYAYIGYETATRCRCTDPKQRAPLSIWQLAQLPAGGQMLVPTYGTAPVSRFFGAENSPRIAIEPGHVRFTIDARESFKASIKAPYVTGRMGYYRPLGPERATLFVRQFAVRPSAAYGDAFYPNLDDPGHCVQVYNDDGTLGDFGEMEYHSPLLGSFGGSTLEDTNETFVYAGAADTVERIRRLLLGG